MNLLDLAAAAVCSTVTSARAIRSIETQQNARLKQDGSFVTDADYAAQGAIFKAMQAVSTHVRLMGEESPSEMAQHVAAADDTAAEEESNAAAKDKELWELARQEFTVFHTNKCMENLLAG